MTIIRFATTPESYSFELWMEERPYTETILPAFDQLFPDKFPTRFSKQQLEQFREILKQDIQKRADNYKPPTIGNRFPVEIFGKHYLLAVLMNKDHATLYKLYMLYECIEESLQKEHTVHIVYPYQDK
ncbi:MAG: hypothetical protein K0R65_1504 [Crocinitomicaceae bacterium]|jgi:hypothetical protein|nr:hypothetical protein [Crocinitomicaceae bacterium]